MKASWIAFAQDARAVVEEFFAEGQEEGYNRLCTAAEGGLIWLFSTKRGV
jgi:hypothetical protein